MTDSNFTDTPSDAVKRANIAARVNHLKENDPEFAGLCAIEDSLLRDRGFFAEQASLCNSRLFLEQALMDITYPEDTALGKLTSSFISAMINNKGYNVVLPKQDNESNKAFATRTKSVALELTEAFEGCTVRSGKNGRLYITPADNSELAEGLKDIHRSYTQQQINTSLGTIMKCVVNMCRVEGDYISGRIVERYHQAAPIPG